MTEGQGKSSTAPTFSKLGYNNQALLHEADHQVGVAGAPTTEVLSLLVNLAFTQALNDMYVSQNNFSFCKGILYLKWTLFYCHGKQVDQRATIAHLSPMCQGQISLQKTYKWAMETRGLKSNLSEFLCLSWLPATLMMI